MPQKLKEIKFNKYLERSDYHWQGIKKNIFTFNAFLQARYELILRQLPKLVKTDKVLDVGCGDGALSYLISKEKGGKIYGIDTSFEAIKIAKNKCRKLNQEFCQFQVASAYALPFPSNIFKFVICADVIEHVCRPEKILKEIKRVLEPKGRAIVSSVIKTSEKTQDKMHVREYTVEEMQNFMEKYFKKVSILQSHPLIFKKIYQFYLRIGRYKPQPGRYLINFLTILINDLNPFLTKIGKLTCQLAVGYKP